MVDNGWGSWSHLTWPIRLQQLVSRRWLVGEKDFPLRRARIIDTVVVSVRLLSGLGNCFVLNFFCSVVHSAFVIGVMTLYTFQAVFIHFSHNRYFYCHSNGEEKFLPDWFMFRPRFSSLTDWIDKPRNYCYLFYCLFWSLFTSALTISSLFLATHRSHFS